MEKMKIKEKLKEIRSMCHQEGKPLTQKEFAKFIGIPLRTYEDWERGAHTPPEYVVNLIKYKAEHEFSWFII
jgi:DNA-binding transcriptional regulator YiaG